MFGDIDVLVPEDYLLRKIEKVMDYDWLYERLELYYCKTESGKKLYAKREKTIERVFAEAKENMRWGTCI